MKSVLLSMKRLTIIVAVMVLFAVAVGAAPVFAQSTGSSGSATVSGIATVMPAQYCPQILTSLALGSRGAQVSMLQQFLNQRYGNQGITGYFGAATRANIIRFQREFGISPVGTVGPMTRAKLQHLCTGGTGGGSDTTKTSLSATPATGVAPLSVSFRGFVSDDASYIITYGDGTNSGSMQAACLMDRSIHTGGDTVNTCVVDVSHAYATPGTYTANLESYIGCMWSNPRCMIATRTLGQVTVTVTPQSVGGVTVSTPAAGATFARGQDMPISWGYPVTPNSTKMAVELYTAAGVKIGLIAVSNDTSGSYTWHVPGFPQNYMCTMQYPNALCGTSIPNGQYYIKVSAELDPLGSNTAVIASGQSGIFTMTGAQ